MEQTRVRLQQRLASKFQDGSCRLVPIIGSGLHHHLRAHGVPNFDVCDPSGLANWSELLVSASLDRKGRPEFHLPRLASDDDPTFVWESMLTARARALNGGPTSRQEVRLRNRIVRSIQRETPPAETLDAFGRALAGRRFRDMVSLNFDRTLDRALRRARVATSVHGWCPSGPKDEAQQGVSDHTAVWHPHGVVAEPNALATADNSRFPPSAIQLGLRHYALSTRRVLRHVEYFRKRKGQWKSSSKQTEPFHELVRAQPKSWVDVLLNSDIVFIGCGLNRAELDLWLLLHERQRELARVQENERPLAFFLHPYEGFPRHICKKSAGLLPVITRDHDECWELLLGRWWC